MIVIHLLLPLLWCDGRSSYVACRKAGVLLHRRDQKAGYQADANARVLLRTAHSESGAVSERSRGTSDEVYNV